MTLRHAALIAQEEASEILPNIWQLLVLFTAWKTYKWVMSTVVFGGLLPAAGFLEVCKHFLKLICKKNKNET